VSRGAVGGAAAGDGDGADVGGVGNATESCDGKMEWVEAQETELKQRRALRSTPRIAPECSEGSVVGHVVSLGKARNTRTSRCAS
jgi:hypothetical protein